MIEFLAVINIVLGTLLISQYNKRITDSKEQIKEYKQGFKDGYETQNGYKPYQEGEKKNDVYSSDLGAYINELNQKFEEEEEEKNEKERWDD